MARVASPERDTSRSGPRNIVLSPPRGQSRRLRKYRVYTAKGIQTLRKAQAPPTMSIASRIPGTDTIRNPEDPAQGREITLAIDLGTNNSIQAIRWPQDGVRTIPMDHRFTNESRDNISTVPTSRRIQAAPISSTRSQQCHRSSNMTSTKNRSDMGTKPTLQARER